MNFEQITVSLQLPFLSNSYLLSSSFRCFKIVKDWTIDVDGPRNVKAFFDRITKDIGKKLAKS